MLMALLSADTAFRQDVDAADLVKETRTADTALSEIHVASCKHITQQNLYIAQLNFNK